jgi:hypothetical protein
MRSSWLSARSNMQINISEAMRQVLLGAVKYALSRNANIWSETGYDDDQGVDLEDALLMLGEAEKWTKS